jgi:hypothetical protein
MAEESDKSDLIAQLAQARYGVSANVRGLKRDLNVVRRIETAFQRHRIIWLAGAAMLGLLLARLPGRKKVVVVPKLRKSRAEEKAVKAGLLVTVLKLAFDVSRPFLQKWVTRKVSDYARQRFVARR